MYVAIAPGVAARERHRSHIDARRGQANLNGRQRPRRVPDRMDADAIAPRLEVRDTEAAVGARDRVSHRYRFDSGDVHDRRADRRLARSIHYQAVDVAAGWRGQGGILSCGLSAGRECGEREEADYSH